MFATDLTEGLAEWIMMSPALFVLVFRSSAKHNDSQTMKDVIAFMMQWTDGLEFCPYPIPVVGG